MRERSVQGELGRYAGVWPYSTAPHVGEEHTHCVSFVGLPFWSVSTVLYMVPLHLLQPLVSIRCPTAILL